MVDINKKKDRSDSKDKKKKDKESVKSRNSGGSSGESGSGGASTEPYKMSDETTANVDDASVSGTSKRWSQEGAELNYDAASGGSEKEYIQRQIEESQEFYENYLETAKDNLEDINQFTLYHHALLLSTAKNRAGICDIFMNRFGYSEEKALEKASQVCQKAGEPEAFVKLADEVTTNIRED